MAIELDRIELSDTEVLAAFETSYIDETSGQLVCEGVKAVGSALIDLFEGAFRHDPSGEPLDVFPNANRLYRLIQPDVGDGVVQPNGDVDDLPMQCVIMGIPYPVSPTLGQVSGPNWLEVGEYEPGRTRLLNFPYRKLMNLLVDVYVIRETSISVMDDMSIWELLWIKNQYLRVGSSLSYRTRMVQAMVTQQVISQFSNLTLVKGIVEIQRVMIADPRFAEESAYLERINTTVHGQVC